MKNKSNLIWSCLSLAALTSLIVPSMAVAQSTTSVMIPITNQMVERTNNPDVLRINLINEARKANPALKAIPNLEVQMVRIEAKSGIGGSQVFLRVNNEIMDSQVIDTDPDQVNSGDPATFQRVELKNIDRSVINEASFLIQSWTNFRLRSLELILGQVQEPVIFGRYADEQANIIGGANSGVGTQADANPEVVRPADEALSTIYTKYYLGNQAVLDAQAAAQAAAQNAAQVAAANPAPVVQVPVQQQVAVQQAPVAQSRPAVAPVAAAVAPKCVRHQDGYDVCVGDRVKNVWRFSGQVLAVNTATRNVTIKFDYKDEPVTGVVDSYRK